MKRIKFLIPIFVLSLFLYFPNVIKAQPGNPPGDPDEGGGGPIGGNAPIASGITILLTLGAAYGGRKTYRLLKQENTND